MRNLSNGRLFPPTDRMGDGTSLLVFGDNYGLNYAHILPLKKATHMQFMWGLALLSPVVNCFNLHALALLTSPSPDPQITWVTSCMFMLQAVSRPARKHRELATILTYLTPPYHFPVAVHEFARCARLWLCVYGDGWHMDKRWIPTADGDHDVVDATLRWQRRAWRWFAVLGVSPTSPVFVDLGRACTGLWIEAKDDIVTKERR